MNEHHYQRIDKGMERQKYPTIPPRSNLAKTPLKDIPKDRREQIAAEVMSRYLHGEQVAQMAPEFETSDVTLYALLLRDHENEWKDAQIARSLAKLESSKQDLTDAQDPLSLARAREHIRSAQWELERLLSRIFGVKQEVTHKVDVVDLDQALALQAGVILARLSGSVIENPPQPHRLSASLALESIEDVEALKP